jgi:hypothetical protein
MTASHRSWSKVPGFIGATVLALLLVAACSGKAGSGESCVKDSDCDSDKCALNQLCAPGDCECTGADCGKVQSSCDEGSVCVAGQPPFEIGYNHCRHTCTVDTDCPSDQHCDTGLCAAGGPPFELTWVNIPRAKACEARVPCPYEVRPADGITVASYSWTFGTSAPVVTTDPTTSFTYPATGVFAVAVVATATNGGTGRLSTSETLCSGGIGSPCTADVPCCSGTCNGAAICE